MIIFDTDCVVGMMRGDEDAIEKIREHRTRGDRLAITSLTAFELLKGAYLSDDPERERARLLEVIETFYVVDLSYLGADAAAKADAALSEKGTKTGTIDVLIAGICLSTRKTLITRNVKHFQNIDGLDVESW